MRERTLFGGIIAAFIVLGTYYSIVTPLFEAPDEVWHYAYVREVALRRGFPVMQLGTEQAWAQEGTQAPLYYALGAPLIAWIDARQLERLPTPNPFARIGEPATATNDNRNAFLHTSDENFPWRGTALAVHLLRLYSLVLGTLTIGLTFTLARAVFPALRAVPFVAALFVASLPQFLFLSASINNDNLATLLATATLWQLARIAQYGLTYRRTVLLGMLVGLALLAKFNTVTLVPFTLLAIVLVAWSRRAWRNMFVYVSVFLLVVTLVAGWWYARNLVLYGDVSGLALMIELVGARAAPISLTRWLSAETEGLRFSTWGVFGWMNILAAPAFYWFYDWLALAGLVGGLVALARQRIQLLVARRVEQLHMPTFLALWCVIAFTALAYYNRELSAAQGRLLFPALGAFAVLWARGIVELIPPRALTLLGMLQLGVAALTPVLFIAPAYTPTRVDALAPDALRVNDATILGARVNRAPTQPGDTLDITIYSRVLDEQSARRAVFVHLVNSANIIVAQRDSAIGSGNWKTLSYPSIIADTLRVQVPLTTFAPDEWRIVIGAYDLISRERLGEPIILAHQYARENRLAWQFDFDGRATLLRANISSQVVVRGGTLRVRLQWNAAPWAHWIFVHALGKADHIWAKADAALAREMELDLRFAPNTPPDIYPLELGMYSRDGVRVPVFDAQGQMLGDRLFIGTIRVVDN